MIPVLVAALLVSATPLDTVFTVDGGRVVGSVLEESPSTGVTIQTPDGAVRRIAAAQVARVEFSDGTVSEARPAAPAPVPPPPPAQHTAGPPDTVFLAGGGRARGSVLEEDPRTGAKIRLLDGSLHTYAPEEISRIEYADGTVSRRKTAEAAPITAAPPRPEPAPAARASPAEAPVDTVYFIGGGRVRGTVIEESSATGVRIRLLDGTLRTYSREELNRVEYADGTVSRRKAPAAAPVPAPPPLPPPAQPATIAPPPPPPPAAPRTQLVPFYLTLGAGATWFGGDAERNVQMQQLFATQGHLSSEFGLRLSPAWAIGVYGDVGGGDVAAPILTQCQTQGLDCIGTTRRFGFLIRHTWDPFSATSKWISLGTGWEAGGASAAHADRGTELFTYSGRERVRLGAGFDFRSNEVLGLGMYASFAWGEYDEYKDSTGTYSLDRRTHTTGQVGIRLTLFP